jgi:hypothetical protein
LSFGKYQIVLHSYSSCCNTDEDRILSLIKFIQSIIQALSGGHVIRAHQWVYQGNINRLVRLERGNSETDIISTKAMNQELSIYLICFLKFNAETSTWHEPTLLHLKHIVIALERMLGVVQRIQFRCFPFPNVQVYVCCLDKLILTIPDSSPLSILYFLDG